MQFTKIQICFLRLISAAFLVSCNEQKAHEKSMPPKEEIMLFSPYSYSQNIKAYLHQEFKFTSDSLSVDTLFFIPLNSCDKCVNVIMQSLKSNKFSGKIIFGGEIKYKPVFKDLYEELTANHLCFVDEKYKMYKYDLGIYGPSLLILSKNKPVIAQLDYHNWKNVSKELGWK